MLYGSTKPVLKKNMKSFNKKLLNVTDPRDRITNTSSLVQKPTSKTAVKDEKDIIVSLVTNLRST